MQLKIISRNFQLFLGIPSLFPFCPCGFKPHTAAHMFTCIYIEQQQNACIYCKNNVHRQHNISKKMLTYANLVLGIQHFYPQTFGANPKSPVDCKSLSCTSIGGVDMRLSIYLLRNPKQAYNQRCRFFSHRLENSFFLDFLLQVFKCSSNKSTVFRDILVRRNYLIP